MRKLINLAWFFTFMAFFASLIISYAFLPEQVGIHADYEGVTDKFISKGVFFYVGLFGFAVSNLVFFFLVRVMDAVPATSGLYFRNRVFKDNITGWFGGFAAVINIFLIFGAAYIALFNNQGDYQMSQFNHLLYIAPILAICSLAWLVYIFLNRRN